LGDPPPANSVTFTDPPSVEGTSGPQIAPEKAGPAADPAADPDADVVDFAAWVDASDASPRNCRGACGLVDAGAVIDADDPAAFVVPVTGPVAPPPSAKPCDDGNGDVATLN